MGRILAAMLGLWLPLSSAAAGDWPGLMGPSQSGVAQERGLARQWPAQGPPVLWTVEVGRGWGGPSIHGGQVFLLDRPDDQHDLLRCLDLATGREVWSLVLKDPGRFKSFPGSRNVPAVDEQRVFVVGPMGAVTCVDRQSHRIIWAHHLASQYKATAPVEPPRRREPLVPDWGFTANPVLYQDMVIVAPQTTVVGLVAYGKADGKVRWESPPVGRNRYSYATPLLTQLRGVEQLVVLGNLEIGRRPPALISGVEAATGKRLWQIRTWKQFNIPMGMPARLGEDRLFVTGGYGIGCFIVALEKTDQRWTASFAMKDNDHCGAHVHSPIFYKGHIYANSHDRYSRLEQNGLVCLDEQGQLKWRSGPRVMFDNGGLLIAEDLIYILNGATGELHLVEAAPEAFKPLARAAILEARDESAWAPLAMADGKLLVRDSRQMKCLDVRGGGGPTSAPSPAPGAGTRAAPSP
jgi:outer membrane protein assembly factor BamB